MTTNVQRELTRKLLDRMRSGDLPWRKQWEHTGAATMPFNWSSKIGYTGINIVILWMAMDDFGYEHNAWLTFKQAQSLGGRVRKGEKGVTCVYYKTLKREVETNDGGTEEHSFPMLKRFTVFNIAQIDGLEDLPQPPEIREYAETEIVDAVDQIAAVYCKSTGLCIVRGGNRCFYRPSTDEVHIVNQFVDGNAYAGVLIHELIHSTGHKSRLARPRITGSESDQAAIAFEELVAELGSAFGCAEIGVQGRYDEHASYLQSWMSALENDERYFFRAAAAASLAHRYLFNGGEIEQQVRSSEVA